MSLGLNGLVNCMSASTPGLIPEKLLTDEVLLKRPGLCTYASWFSPR